MRYKMRDWVHAYVRAILAVSVLLEEFAVAEQALNVSITVDYTPPPGSNLGTNEYRAASGPVIVTCKSGRANHVTYLWSSTCGDCTFSNSAKQEIYRAAVHSGDNGTHTCTVTVMSNGAVVVNGSASINFNIMGAGIHVFRGNSTGDLGSLSNNEIIIASNTDPQYRFRFVCRSDSMKENVGTLIGPDGTNVTTGGAFNITNPRVGELFVESRPMKQSNLTASDQGVYTCHIPLQNGTIKDINIGIYPSGFSTPPNITSVTHEAETSHLTCVSTGSPATNVTWRRNGQPLTIDGSLYQLTQTVTNRSLSTYENVLTISDIDRCSYTCTVTNALGNDSQTYFPLPRVSVSSPSQTVTAGESLSLECTVTVAVGDSLSVQWTGPDVVTSSGITQQTMTDDCIMTYTSTLKLSPIRTSHGGQYQCMATSNGGISVDTETVTVRKLDVSITVSYVPPPGAELGPNEYRAASGPVTVTCTVVGGTGPVSYQWSSTCSRCPFQTANSTSVTRVAVRAGDIGNHTCTATSGLISGSKTISFDVVGAGIHVFRGTATGDLEVPGSLPNNGIVISLGTARFGFYFRFVCRSGSMMNNVGMVIGPDGTIVTSGSVFNITHPQPGELIVENTPSQNVLTANDQGVYTCHIPLQSGAMRYINVGIYSSGFNVPPNITHLGFTYGHLSSNLTCISTGSPATAVTWMRDSQPLSLPDDTYTQIQTITDRRLSTYQTVLIIDAAATDITGHTYNCTVLNALGTASKELMAFDPLTVTISPPETPTAGESFSLTCTVSLAEGASLIGAVEWMGPDGVPISSTHRATTNIYISTLEFNPVMTSHGGEYICQATSSAGTMMDATLLTVQIPLPTLTVSREPDASVLLRHGDNLTLTCTIRPDPNPAVDSDVVVTGRLQGVGRNDTTVTNSDGVYKVMLYIPSLRATSSDTYTCIGTVEPGSGMMYVQRSESCYSLNITVGSSSSSVSPGAVAGAAAGVLIVALVVIIIVAALWLKWRVKLHFQPQAKWPIAGASLELTVTGKDQVEKTREINSYRPAQSNSEGMLVAWFSAHVTNMHADKDRGFRSEYESLKKGLLASHDAGLLPCNKLRNRFRNIYPYDFCRVKLKEIEGVEGSDYINASFVEGYTKQNEYIASQGPVPGTAGDLWRMVWEHKITTIAMLTRCVELGKKKCEQYWPKAVNETEEVGYNLTVTLTSLLPFAEYEIRTFIVKDTSIPTKPALEVTHFFYQAWPDHGVPSNAMSLINFIERVRKSHPPSHPHPLLVHCSAGVGRTGTFIVLDMEMQRIKDMGVVNVFGCLEELRRQRVQMVQTLAQYTFIHTALDELITCGKTDVSAANLRIITSQLHQTADDKQVSGFQDQFELLKQISPKMETEDFSDAAAECNISKNRYASKVAGNYCRVYLRTQSDYINANFVNGYRKRGAYIATQGPLSTTVKDFWRMIIECQSKCIVMLCSLLEEGEESCYPYWPTDQGLTRKYGEIGVTLKSEEKYYAYMVRKFEVLEDKSKSTAETRGPSPFTVTQFQLLCWPKRDPPSPPVLLEVLENVNRVQMTTGNKAITVMCNDGMGRTGAFICMHAQIERLKTEGVVDFFQFIKSARLNRPGLVQSVEQYILCHEVLKEFVGSFETYCNFQEVV